MAEEKETEGLLQSMDNAAGELLKVITEPQPGGALSAPTVQEKTKLFEALIDYVKWREKPTAPATPQRSRFQAMKDEFNGNGRDNKTPGGGSGKAGRGRASTPTATETDDGSESKPN